MNRMGAVMLSILMIFSLVEGSSVRDAAVADETHQWVSASNGVYHETVLALAIDPTNTQTMYSASSSGVVFRSTDAGAHWVQRGTVNTGEGHNVVHSLTVDPKSPQTIYAGTNGGVFKSIDGATNWTRTGLKSRDIMSFVMDPTNTQTVYANAGIGVGIYESTDGGVSWSQLGLKSGELDPGLSGELVYSLAISPSNTNVLYAGTSEESICSKGRLFKSLNGGRNWTKSDTGLTTDCVTTLVVDPSDANIVYAGTRVDGVFKTMDGGKSWVKSSNGLSGTGAWVRSLAVGPGNANVLCALTSGGVFKSTDAAGSWSAANTGLPYYTTTQGPRYADVVSVVIDPANPMVMYAGVTGNGTYKTTDGAKNWTRINKGLVQTTSSRVFSLAMDPRDAQVIYAGVDGGNVFRSVDGGANWEKVNKESPPYEFVHLTIDPSDTHVIYAITSNSASDQSNVFKSIDGGATWNQTGLMTTDATSLVIDPTDTRVVYVGTTAAVFKSTDGGARWTKTGLDNPHGFSVTSLSIDPTHSQVVYAGTRGLNGGGSVLKSTDAGVSWIQSVTTNTSVESLLIDPKDNRIVYAGTSGGSVVKSTDGGTNWVQADNGSTKIAGSTLTVDPLDTQVLYAGTSLDGVLKSTDAGRTWSKMNTGLMDNHFYTQVYAFAVDSTDSQVVYVGTDHGVYKMAQLQSHSITSISSLGGSISPLGPITLNSGESKTFTVKPNSGYKISVVKVDGVSKGPVSSYTFTNIISDHTIEAVFEQIVVPPSPRVVVLQIGRSTFTVDGRMTNLDSPPVIKNGRTLVPIRAIIEALGGSVTWDGTARKATVTLGNTSLELWIGKSSATVNGTTTPIDWTNAKVVPEIINGRTMLPLRFVTESLGATVGWDQSTQTITITYQP